jgi:hypothetical protein
MKNKLIGLLTVKDKAMQPLLIGRRTFESRSAANHIFFRRTA